jgi:hypothetical protein
MNNKIAFLTINFFFLSKVKSPLFFSRHLKENVFKMVAMHIQISCDYMPLEFRKIKLSQFSTGSLL